MSNANYRRNTCRLCNGSDLELVLGLKPTPLADSYVPVNALADVQQTFPLDLFLCRGCGFSQLLNIVHPENIYLEYIYETTSSLGLADHFRKYAADVLQQTGCAAGSMVVDIGSNDGTLLRAFQQCGMRVLGVDPAHDIARKATESGIETLPAFFNAETARKIKREYGPAKIVTANNLFANIDDLIDMTEGIGQLLAPDGVFIFESFYLVDSIRNMVFDFIYHEHLSYFSVKPLETFFRRMGMELINVERVPTKGGSLRYTAQLAGGPRDTSPSVAQLMAFETDFGIDRPETFKAFADRIDSAKNKLLHLLRDLKSQGKTIAGYGASATTTTLIYHFELGDLLEYLLDDNPSKQNLFSPGHHIPVLPSEALYQRKPDYVVMLAWRYAEPIMKKHQAYQDGGGHYIIPLPELQVV